MDVRSHNRRAWDQEVRLGNPWTVPVTPAQVAAARRGEVRIQLTPTRPVPSSWLPPLPGCRVLALASGGGQQGPLLAAAGADVTVYDNSPLQLERDREVAAREGLGLRTVEGDMRDLGAFPDAAFDLVVHPVSNLFVPDVRPVWREAARVLGPGGVLVAGFVNPAVYLFDSKKAERDELVVRHRIPYADLTDLTPAERLEVLGPDGPLEFSHTLTDQLAGQLEAGLRLTGLFEDRYPEGSPGLTRYMDVFLATRAVKG